MSAVVTYLRDRKITLAIVLLALAAALSQLLLWWLAPEPNANDLVGPPRSSYTLTNFAMTSYNPEGNPALRVNAPHLERREGDESLYINTPHFDLPAKQPGVPDWLGHSLYGWVDKSGDLMKLQGPVTMHRAAFGTSAAAQIDTSEVSIWPKQDRMETAQAAKMVQGGTTIAGLGMRANLTDKHLELLHDVHATFPPHQAR